MKRLLFALLILLALPAAAHATPQQDLDAAEQVWAARGIDDYSYLLRRSCFCPPGYGDEKRMVVVDGAPAQPKEAFATVPALHAYIQKSIDDKAERVEVTYEKGVPVGIYVDQSSQIADEELGLSVSDFIEGGVAPEPTPEPVTDEPDPSITDGSAARELAGARKRWRKLGLRNYDFRLRLSCFCAPEFTAPRQIRVRRGKARKPGQVRRYATVPKLFAVIQEAIDEGFSGLTVRYGRTGLPRRVSTDRSRLTLDEEFGFSASRLRQP